MKNYTVFFELYGKKMKANVYSYNKDSAKEKIKNKIIFHKIVSKEESNISDDDMVNHFKGIFGMK